MLVPDLALAAGPKLTPGQDFVSIGYSLSSAGEAVVYAGVRDMGGKVATARCAVTTTAWKAAYGKATLEMKLGNVTIYE